MGVSPRVRGDAAARVARYAHGSRIPFVVPQSAPALEELLPFVKNRIIRISFSDEISAPSRDWIEQQLVRSLGLDLASGDRVITGTLPEAVTDDWIKWLKKTSSVSITDKPVTAPTPIPAPKPMIPYEILGAVLILVAALFLILFWKGLRNLAHDLTSELGKISSPSTTMGEAIEARQRSQTPEPEKIKPAGPDSTEDQTHLLEKIDPLALKLFVYDCSGLTQTRNYPAAIIYRILSKVDLARKLDQEIEEEFKPISSRITETPSRKEIEGVLYPLLPQYKAISRNEFTATLAKQSMEWLRHLAGYLDLDELGMLLDLLPPLKMRALAEGLDLQIRLQLFQKSSETKTAHEDAQILGRVKSAAEKLLIQTRNQTSTGSDSFAARYKNNILLKIETFEEEEVLYQASRQIKGVYVGLLSLLNEGSVSFWNQVDVRDLANCIGGYNPEVRAICEKFLSPRRYQWLVSFLERMETVSHEYTSPSVVESRNRILDSFKLELAQLMKPVKNEGQIRKTA